MNKKKTRGIGKERVVPRVLSISKSLSLRLNLASEGSFHWDILGHYEVTGLV